MECWDLKELPRQTHRRRISRLLRPQSPVYLDIYGRLEDGTLHHTGRGFECRTMGLFSIEADSLTVVMDVTKHDLFLDAFPLSFLCRLRHLLSICFLCHAFVDCRQRLGCIFHAADGGIGAYDGRSMLANIAEGSLQRPVQPLCGSQKMKGVRQVASSTVTNRELARNVSKRTTFLYIGHSP
jgi:hypothetical protein